MDFDFFPSVFLIVMCLVFCAMPSAVFFGAARSERRTCSPSSIPLHTTSTSKLYGRNNIDARHTHPFDTEHVLHTKGGGLTPSRPICHDAQSRSERSTRGSTRCAMTYRLGKLSF
ncbi:hypothetical protein J3F84DRAFT_384528 [Trichoderma pleuroticola]